MGLREKVTRMVGGESESDERTEREADREPAADRDPSHRCQSCGEQYFTDPDMEIRSCRECGGVKVESVVDDGADRSDPPTGRR